MESGTRPTDHLYSHALDPPKPEVSTWELVWPESMKCSFMRGNLGLSVLTMAWKSKSRYIEETKILR
jgi:hypothetical protein